MGLFNRKSKSVCIPQEEPIAPHLEKARKILLNPRLVGDRHVKYDKLYDAYSRPSFTYDVKFTPYGYYLNGSYNNTLLRRPEWIKEQDYSSKEALNASIANLNDAYETLYGYEARDAWDKGCCECKCN